MLFWCIFYHLSEINIKWKKYFFFTSAYNGKIYLDISALNTQYINMDKYRDMYIICTVVQQTRTQISESNTELHIFWSYKQVTHIGLLFIPTYTHVHKAYNGPKVRFWGRGYFQKILKDVFFSVLLSGNLKYSRVFHTLYAS